MMSHFKNLRLLFLLAIPLANVVAAQRDFVIDAAPSMMRGESFGEEHGRRLTYSSSWSFSNLLFHLGVCHASSDCENHRGPCGCPDCSKPHPPHFQNSYCENLSVSSYSTTDESGSYSYSDDDSGGGGGSSSGSGSGSSSGSDSSYYDEEGSNGVMQNATRLFSGWVFMAAGAAVAAIAVAVVMRKRKRASTTDQNAKELSADGASISDYKLMGGMTAAFAGVMTRMGLRGSGDGDESTTSGSSGIVSKRMGLLQSGADVSPLHGLAPTPSFIDIPADLHSSTMPETMEADEGIEVEGPFRPSNQYAI